MPSSSPPAIAQPTFIILIGGSILAAVANSITYKVLLNKYKSNEHHHASSQHNYEFFVNQFNVMIYVVMCACVLTLKALAVGPSRFLSQQNIPWMKFAVMGFLDAFSGFLSTIGGANCSGSLQNLLNQCIIPATMVASYFFLKERINLIQGVGATCILVGASVSFLPALMHPTAGTSTTAGILIFVASLLPSASSNVYKEACFRSKTDEMAVDVNLLSAIVAIFQVLIGFSFMPILAMPAFGGLPFSEMPNQMKLGFQCFLGQDPLPGDHCAGVTWHQSATFAMMNYCVVNFTYNLLQLLVTKHGSAVLMVVSSALALPLTNFAFSSRALMGHYVDKTSMADIAALVIVVSGFVVYSFDGLGDNGKSKKRRARLLPLQAAGGSMAYFRERSNSDPASLMWSPKVYRSPRFDRYSPSSSVLQKTTGTPRETLPFAQSSRGVQYEALTSTPPINVAISPISLDNEAKQEASSL